MQLVKVSEVVVMVIYPLEDLLYLAAVYHHLKNERKIHRTNYKIIVK